MDPIAVVFIVVAVICGALYFLWPSPNSEVPKVKEESGYLEIGKCPSCGRVLLISSARKLVDAPLSSDCDFEVIAVCGHGGCTKVSRHPIERGNNKLVLVERAIRVNCDRLASQKKNT
jgi:hypothetical protein